MVATATKYAHIEIDANGVPIIAGTKTKVVELVMERMADGSSAEQLHAEHPYLSLGQIYSALAYYADHKKELDADIARRCAEVDRLEQEFRAREAASSPPLQARLQSRTVDEIGRLCAELRSGKPLREIWPEIELGRADNR